MVPRESRSLPSVNNWFKLLYTVLLSCDFSQWGLSVDVIFVPVTWQQTAKAQWARSLYAALKSEQSYKTPLTRIVSSWRVHVYATLRRPHAMKSPPDQLLTANADAVGQQHFNACTNSSRRHYIPCIITRTYTARLARAQNSPIERTERRATTQEGRTPFGHYKNCCTLRTATTSVHICTRNNIEKW